MKSSTQTKNYRFWQRLAGLLMCMLLLPFLNNVQAQNCTSPPSALVNGNFNLPATAIVTNSATAINNNMPGWFVSHGDPTTQALPDRSMWMWSYRHSSGQQRGEGVFNCYDFQAGQSYLICFDLQTNGKADGATVNVQATSALSASSGAYAFPVVANEVIWQDLVANYDYNNWYNISVVYTPTSNYTQIWFHPLWTGTPPGTPAPQGNPSQSEMRIDNVSISPIGGGQACPCDVTADYTFTAGDTCTVQFNEASSGNCCTNVLGWQWDFGDGTTGTGANPLHTFPGSGTYTVCLTTVGLNDAGDCCTDSVCYDVTVDCDTCTCDINADFGFSVDRCRVRFEDLSTFSSCTEITGWEWDFGDGNTSTLQNPIHTYAASGVYTVCLKVFGTDGTQECESTICYDVEVECDKDCPCVANLDFGFDINKCEVNFFGFADADCEIVGWSWDFGDGNTSTLQNPTHTYAANGIYTVCFTVIMMAPDGSLCDETICLQIEIRDCFNPDQPAPGFKTTPGSGSNQVQGLPFAPRVYPNPSSGRLYVAFENETALDVHIAVYNAAMQQVATLLNGKQEAGAHTVEWAADKAEFASGTYYIMIKHGHVAKLEKVLLNK